MSISIETLQCYLPDKFRGESTHAADQLVARITQSLIHAREMTDLAKSKLFQLKHRHVSARYRSILAEYGVAIDGFDFYKARVMADAAQLAKLLPAMVLQSQGPGDHGPNGAPDFSSRIQNSVLCSRLLSGLTPYLSAMSQQFFDESLPERARSWLAEIYAELRDKELHWGPIQPQHALFDGMDLPFIADACEEPVFVQLYQDLGNLESVSEQAKRYIAHYTTTKSRCFNQAQLEERLRGAPEGQAQLLREQFRDNQLDYAIAADTISEYRWPMHSAEMKCWASMVEANKALQAQNDSNVLRNNIMAAKCCHVAALRIHDKLTDETNVSDEREQSAWEELDRSFEALCDNQPTAEQTD